MVLNWDIKINDNNIKYKLIISMNMSNQDCKEIRRQVMFFIDNELPESSRADLILHFNQCEDCQKFFESEQEIKSKICSKIKDSYICQCDEHRLKSSIKDMISEIK